MTHPRVSADWIDREDGKDLELLTFALKRNNVEPSWWAVAKTFEQLGPVDDCLCLYKEGDVWVIANTERGRWSCRCTFERCFDAVRFFYSRFVEGPTPYNYLDEWKRETGQEFSQDGMFEGDIANG